MGHFPPAGQKQEEEGWLPEIHYDHLVGSDRWHLGLRVLEDVHLGRSPPGVIGRDSWWASIDLSIGSLLGFEAALVSDFELGLWIQIDLAWPLWSLG